MHRQSPPARPLVAFDFDGTLTVRDSYTAFLRWRAGPWRYALAIAALAPDLVAYLWRRDRGRLKAALTSRLLRGASRAALEADAERFAAATFERLIRPDALAAWRAHDEAGHLKAIVTASPDLVVAPFARRLGAEALIGTRLAFDAQGLATGGFDGANCRGVEKVIRLEAVFGGGIRPTAAYGDTSGDREMLARADEPGFRVFTARPGSTSVRRRGDRGWGRAARPGRAARS